MKVAIPLKLVYDAYELNLYRELYNGKPTDSRAFALAAFSPFAAVLLRLSNNRRKTLSALNQFYEERLKHLEEYTKDAVLAAEAFSKAEELAEYEVCHTAKVLVSPLIAANDNISEDEKKSLLLELAVNGQVLGISLITDITAEIELQKCDNRF